MLSKEVLVAEGMISLLAIPGLRRVSAWSTFLCYRLDCLERLRLNGNFHVGDPVTAVTDMKV